MMIPQTDFSLGNSIGWKFVNDGGEDSAEQDQTACHV